jgi:hypothetical protein
VRDRWELTLTAPAEVEVRHLPDGRTLVRAVGGLELDLWLPPGTVWHLPDPPPATDVHSGPADQVRGPMPIVIGDLPHESPAPAAVPPAPLPVAGPPPRPAAPAPLRPPSSFASCGTLDGYRQHALRGERPCYRCVQAEARARAERTVLLPAEGGAADGR